VKDEPQDDDDELVRLMIAYQAGQLAAFESLYAALAADLSRYFAAAISTGAGAGPGAGSAVQDLVQDTFLAIHRSRRTYLPPLPVRPWVWGIARNVLGRHRRTAWRRSRHEDRAIDPGDARVETRAAIEPRDVEEALRRLPARGREVWVLHHVHGWSFQQIALRFQIGVGAAKLRSSRAMKALRASLGIERGARDG
jgi:RNA polymerase sigma-70 factor (ECF subfamily)